MNIGRIFSLRRRGFCSMKEQYNSCDNIEVFIGTLGFSFYGLCVYKVFKDGNKYRENIKNQPTDESTTKPSENVINYNKSYRCSKSRCKGSLSGSCHCSACKEGKKKDCWHKNSIFRIRKD